MPYAPTSSSKIQFGPEVTNGTPVAATKIWRGPAVDIMDDSEVKRPGTQENVGLMLPTGRTYKSRTAASLSIPETEATFEQFPYLLEGSILKATPGAGPTDYLRTYAPSLTGVNAIRTLTFETGNVIGGDVHEMEYSFCSGWTLSGKSGEAWMISRNNWQGRQKTGTTFTGSLSLTGAIEEMLFGRTKLYLDPTTIGTTQATGVLIEASIAYDSGIQPIYSADGTLYFYTHKIVPPKLTFTLTMEMESGGKAAAQRALWVSQASQLFRLEISGSGNSECVIDWAGKYDTPGSYQNDDGDVVIQFKGEAYYDAAASLFLSIAHTNQIAAL